ncbi:uncharacterized protein [Asterias amurensis]|uniref:uncharacterized protein n=1 Tax=Asterias amurensis TaxID=7602 RepID=UPI003AB25CFD
MSRVGLQILVAVFAMAYIESASGCQCTTLHPQQHYCRALYVVRAKVESLQWQLIQRLPTEPHTVPETDTDTVTNPTTDTPASGRTSTPDKEVKNHTVATSPTRPTTDRLPVSVTTSKADEAAVTETDPVPNPDDFQDNIGQQSWPPLDAMPGHRRDDEERKSIMSQEPWNYEILYTVKIEKVYKTVEGKTDSMREGEEVQIKSFYPGGMFCGVELKRGKSYILGGAIQGQIGRCDLVLEYKTVSKRQKQGLRSNYGQFCDKCQIATCHSPQCAAHMPDNTCPYMAHDSYDRHGIGYQEDDCVAAHSKCMPKEGHDMCQWQRNKDLKQCLTETGADVTRELRRHRQRHP